MSTGVWSCTSKGGTARLVLENVNREGDHWLTLERGVGSSASVIGYLRLKPIAGDRHTFEVAEVRPACGPLLHLPGESPAPEARAPEDDACVGQRALLFRKASLMIRPFRPGAFAGDSPRFSFGSRRFLEHWRRGSVKVDGGRHRFQT